MVAVLLLLGLLYPMDGAFVSVVPPPQSSSLSSTISFPRKHVQEVRHASHCTQQQRHDGNFDNNGSGSLSLMLSQTSSTTKEDHDATGITDLSASVIMEQEHEDHKEAEPRLTQLDEPLIRLSSHVVAAVTKIESREDLDEFLMATAADDRAEDNSNHDLRLIQFHALWCKSCQRVRQRMNKLAVQYADRVHDETLRVTKPGRIRIASVEYGASESLFYELGVTALPTIQFYYKSNKKSEDKERKDSSYTRLATVPCGPSEFTTKVTGLVKHFLSLTPEEMDFEAEMERVKELVLEQQQRENQNQPEQQQQQKQQQPKSNALVQKQH